MMPVRRYVWRYTDGASVREAVPNVEKAHAVKLRYERQNQVYKTV